MGKAGKSDVTARALQLVLALLVPLGGERMLAQEVVPVTPEILVMPAVPYEPGRPQAKQPAAIATVGFVQPGEETPGPAPVDLNPLPPPNPYRFWARADYLYWWVTNAPISAPLVTTNTPPAIGALNEAGTKILFGAGSGQNAGFGGSSGVRLTLGGWIDSNHEASWEATGFVLGRQTFTFNAASMGGTAPIVSIPFNATQAFGTNPAGETALSSGGAPSNASVQLNSQLWGIELNEAVYLSSSQRYYWAALFGFRYLSLNENLNTIYTTLDTSNNGTVAVADSFGTRNQYCGVQIGTRVGIDLGRWNIDTAAMVAFGNNHQLLDIGGGTTVNGGAFGFTNGTTPGGVFAQPSNIGGISRDMFSYVPAVSFKLGYSITTGINAFAGYNGLYFSNVVRPGNQIDRNVNPTQNAFFVPPGTLTGTATPLAAFTSSALWAHGIQLGLEIRY